MGYKNSDIKVYGRFWSETTDSKIIDASQIDGFNLENGTGTGSLVQKTVSSSGTPYANEASGSGAIGLGKGVKSNGNTTFVTGQKNEAIAGTSASFTSGYSNINRGSYNIVGGENNANNNSWNLVVGKNNAVSDGRFGIVSGLENVYTGPGGYDNTTVSMLGNNLYVQGYQPSNGALLIGQYNDVTRTSDKLFIVGNGTAENRKNAFEVLFDGRAKIQTTPQDTDDVANKGYIDDSINALAGNGMDGTGNPPLQGYNKDKGTIEERLTNLGFNLLPETTTYSFTLGGTTLATVEVIKGTSQEADREISSYKQGKFVHLRCKVQIMGYTIHSTDLTSGFARFYWGSQGNDADRQLVSASALPEGFRPKAGQNAVRPIYVRRRMSARAGLIGGDIPPEASAAVSVPHCLQLYIDSDGKFHLVNSYGSRLTGTLMSGSDSASLSTTDVISNTENEIEICYSTD